MYGGLSVLGLRSAEAPFTKYPSAMWRLELWVPMRKEASVKRWS